MTTDNPTPDEDRALAAAVRRLFERFGVDDWDGLHRLWFDVVDERTLLEAERVVLDEQKTVLEAELARGREGGEQ